MKRIPFALAIVVYFGVIAWSIRSRRQPSVQWVIVTVHAGDTPWELCDRANDDSVDLRAAVRLMQEKTPGTIQPGQVVKVPVLR